MISNPCTWFSGGGSFDDMVEYTYGDPDVAECPKYLWHFSPCINKLSEHMDNNIVWFANDVETAMSILKRMCIFRMGVAKRQMEYHGVPKPGIYEAGNRYSNEEYAYHIYESYFNLIESGKCIITMVIPNQFFKVGWASNDTLT